MLALLSLPCPTEDSRAEVIASLASGGPGGGVSGGQGDEPEGAGLPQRVRSAAHPYRPRQSPLAVSLCTSLLAACLLLGFVRLIGRLVWRQEGGGAALGALKAKIGAEQDPALAELMAVDGS